jgi:hypothetical protein
MGRGSVFFSCRQSHPSLAHVSGGVCSRVCFPFSDSVLHCVPCPRPRLSHILLRRTWALQPLCPYLCVDALASCALRRYPLPTASMSPDPDPASALSCGDAPGLYPLRLRLWLCMSAANPFSAPSHCVLRLRPLCPSPSPTSAPPLCLYVPALSLVLPQSPLPRPKYERRSLFFVFFR